MIDLLLCTDLDRTLLPNGRQPESPAARDLFRKLATHPGVKLVYVTGRDLGLAEEAVAAYDLPVPSHLIADVGTAIFSRRTGGWERWSDWDRKIRADWGLSRAQLQRLLEGVPGLTLQEESRQAPAKLSYYADLAADPAAALAAVRDRLAACSVQASVVWSVDDAAGGGLLDILPAHATKLHAIEFLLEGLGLKDTAVLFAGDSGNDLDVLASGLAAVLVANAAEDVKQEALRLARRQGQADRLHVAQGGFLGLNGHYAGGILEGVAHFFPRIAAWLEAET